MLVREGEERLITHVCEREERPAMHARETVNIKNECDRIRGEDNDMQEKERGVSVNVSERGRKRCQCN